MKGTIINTITILIGSVSGMLLGSKLPDRLKKIVINCIGLFTILIGTTMMLKVQDVLIVLLSLVLGGITGEALDIEVHLTRFAEKIKNKIKPGSSSFVEGFITATMIFCIGAMTVVGSIQEGLTGDPTILYTKSVMDGITSMTLASGFGIGVLFSAIPVFLIQGSLTFLGKSLQFLTAPVYINNLTSTGGLLILAISLDLLGIKKLKVLNLLPAIIYVPLLVFIRTIIF
jgi:uncharacterized membrane protein YqgA involved in biofilm formation